MSRASTEKVRARVRAGIIIEVSATSTPTPDMPVLYRVSCITPLMIMPLRWSPTNVISKSVKPLADPNRIIAAATYAAERSKAPRGERHRRRPQRRHNSQRSVGSRFETEWIWPQSRQARKSWVLCDILFNCRGLHLTLLHSSRRVRWGRWQQIERRLAGRAVRWRRWAARPLDNCLHLIGAHFHHNFRAIRGLGVDQIRFGHDDHFLETALLERVLQLLLRVERYSRIRRHVRRSRGITGLAARHGRSLGECRCSKQDE